ncbi:hypothetical protein C8T65DRAFT_662899 [Cerioporus squamosus]|nr:hypothetical protein C8T65DRAFT_662899 [Cerioporus squamosus]
MGRLRGRAGHAHQTGCPIGRAATGWPRTDLHRSTCLPLLRSSILRPVLCSCSILLVRRSHCARSHSVQSSRASAQRTTRPESPTHSRGTSP